ncbi:MAG: hypothetical protein L6V91_01965 [Bacilli bacterium]|nr:MAG: hypothetical protein L6V91_01965 [Bacilli bacterium]
MMNKYIVRLLVIKKFTVHGYEIKIANNEDKSKVRTIYTLSKKYFFDKAIQDTIKAFC